MAASPCISLTPPPGLEDCQPPKANDGSADGTNINEKEEPVYLPVPGCNNGEWERTVLDLVPYLNDAEAVRMALGILDKAYENARMAKQLDSAVASAMVHGWDLASLGMEAAQAEVAATGQLLLTSLQQLQQQAGIPSGQGQIQWALPTAALAPHPSGSGMPETSRLNAAAQPWVGTVPPKQHLLQGVPESAKAVAAAHANWTEDVSKQQQPAPQPQQQRRKSKRQMQTLSSSLQILSKEDPHCLLIVRRISKLGFKALPILKAHFSSFGSVVRVLSAHSTVRQDGAKSPHQQPRRRPSSLGFVHMGSASAVLTALASGREQTVQGVQILVEKFEQKLDSAAFIDEEEEAEWQRTTSCESAVTSTTAESDIHLETESLGDSEGA